jgi:hypothetical protein
MIRQMKPPVILPLDSRMMRSSRTGVNIAQTHRFPEFLQAPRQPLADALGVIVRVVVVRRSRHGNSCCVDHCQRREPQGGEELECGIH